MRAMAMVMAPLGAALAAALHLLAAGPPGARTVLRVCADPNNLPYSNERGEGFENKIAERLAHALKADLQYTWWPQRRGFVRNTLDAHVCDVVAGKKPGRSGDDEIILYESAGLALLDVGIGHWVYQRARSRGLGTEMPFGEH